MDFDDNAVEAEIGTDPDEYSDVPEPPDLWSLEDFDDLVGSIS